MAVAAYDARVCCEYGMASSASNHWQVRVVDVVQINVGKTLGRNEAGKVVDRLRKRSL